MANANPYNYNLPVGPAMLFGREADVQRLLGAVTSTPGDSVALIGGRRMGKTSLLEALLRVFETPTTTSDRLLLPIFLDLSGEWLGSVMDFFSLICMEVGCALSEQLCDALPRELFLLQEGRPPAPAFRKLLEGWNHAAMAQAGTWLRLMLLLDECERVVEQPWASDLYGALRYLLVGRNTRTLLKVVMVGSHGFLTQVRQHGSPLRNVLKYHTLRALDAQATRDLVVQPTRGMLPEAVVTAVIGQSGGHPFFTQYLMHHLWERGLEDLTPETVERIVAQFPHERRDFYDWMEGIGVTGASAYRVLAQAGASLTEVQIRAALEPAPPDLVQALDALCYHGLVLRDSDGEGYQVAGDMFRSWFVKSVTPVPVSPMVQVSPDTGPQAVPIIVQGDYVAGDKPTGVDQRGQDVHGPQTNIAGDVSGPIASGHFESAAAVGGGEAVDFRGSQGALHKPTGPVDQQFGNRTVVHTTGDVVFGSQPDGSLDLAPSPEATRLHRILVDRMDLEEFRTLCFDLGVSYDSLRGEGLAGRARQLVLFLQKRKALPRLVQWLRRERPDIRNV